MLKYAKVTNEETKECMVGLGTNIEFFKSMGMTEQDVEEAYDGKWYLVGYAPSKPNDVQIQELEKQIVDIYGKLPSNVTLLIEKKRMDVYAGKNL